MKATTIGIALAIGCGQVAAAAGNAPAQYDGIIAKHAAATGVPETLIRRVIVRESRYNPRAMSRGHFGMMQIKPATARSMGYGGSAAGLLDADTNLTYAVRYLAGAYRVARGDHDRAVRLYASGYYYDAKRAGMLAKIGLGRDGKFKGTTTPVAAMAVPTAPGASTQAIQTAAIATPVAPTTPSVPLPQARGAVATPAMAQTTALSAPAAPVVPVPPVRGAVAGPPAAAPAALASAVPTPPIRDAGPAAQTVSVARAAQPAPRTLDPKAAAAPTLGSAAPIPSPRDAGPTVTGSIQTARTVSAVPLPNARDAAGPRTIAITAPVLASAGPVGARPLPPVAPSRPSAPALAYAGSSAVAADDASSQLRGVRASPPKRP